MNEKFTFNDYWGLYKLSCRSFIYEGPSAPNTVNNKSQIKMIIGILFLWHITGNLVLGGILGTPRMLIEHEMGIIVTLISLIAMWGIICGLYLIILNPYYLQYAIRYKKTDWYLNTGYRPSEVCSDLGLFGEYHATMDYEVFKGEHGKIYNGLIIPKRDGNFTELDVVVISEYMIAVIEVKARGGRFSGKILDEKWTQYIGSQVNELQNPVIQNQNHINYLRSYLEDQSNNAPVMCPEFGNIIYFAMPAFVDIKGSSPNVSLEKRSNWRTRNRIQPIEDPETLKILHSIIDILDELPSYTPDEKQRRFSWREKMYQHGMFNHDIVYYPVLNCTGNCEICMDNGFYKFYLKEDGLWRVNACQDNLCEGDPENSFEDAFRQKTQRGW